MPSSLHDKQPYLEFARVLIHVHDGVTRVSIAIVVDEHIICDTCEKAEKGVRPNTSIYASGFHFLVKLFREIGSRKYVKHENQKQKEETHSNTMR